MNKRKIALVHTTLNAVNPIMNFMNENAPEYRFINYLDGYLMDVIKEDKGVTNRSVTRMLDMITKACSDGADAVLMTCTIFSPYQPLFAGLFSVPIICPDGEMQDQVSKMGGRTAIICTFEGTMEPTKKQYLEYCRKNGMPQSVDMYVVPEALKAIELGNQEKGHKLIREKVYELDPVYDQIMLAQISISGAAKGLKTQHAKVFTSPASALELLRKTAGDD